ncbi:MAG: autotransporter-associated beta strand repeat-containing protein [Luteolibacter sp.]
MKPRFFAFSSTSLLAMAVACFACITHQANADTIYWDGVTGNSWNAVASWSSDSAATTPDPAAVPGVNDTATFNITGVNTAQTINLGANQSALGLVVPNTAATSIQGGGTNQTLTIGSGGITVNTGGGAVTIGSATAGQNVGVLLSASQTWAINTGNNLTLNNTLSNSGNTTPVTLTVTGNSGVNLNGVISNGGTTGTVAIVLNASGTTNIGSTTANTYTGGTILKRGTIISPSNAVNPFGATTSTVTMGDSSGSIDVLLRARTVANPIVLSSGTTGNLTIDTVGASAATVSGGVTGTNNLRVMATNGGTMTISTGAINNTGTLTSVSTGTGAGSVTISAQVGSNVTGLTVNNSNTAAKLVLSATSNAYTGNTTVTSGILQLGAANVIPDGTGKGGLVVNGTFDLNQYNETVNGLSGSGTIDKTSNTAASTLTVGGNDATSTFSGVIKNTTGSLALTKTGAGTLTLSGTNTYSGTTTINSGGGNLLITNAAALGSGAAVAIPKGGTATGALQLQLTGTNTLTKNFTFSSATGFTGGGSAHIQNISGTNTLSGNLLLNATGGNGINVQSDAGLLTLSGSISSSVADSTRQFIIAGVGDGAVTGVVSNTGTNVFSVIKGGTGTWTFSGASTYTGSTTLSSGTILIGVSNVGTTSGALGLGTVAIGSASAGGSLLTNGAFTFSNAISFGPAPSSGTNIIGGNTDNTSTFSGAIGLAGNATITQVATTGGNALNITGGIKSTNTGTSTVTFAGPGAINVTTTGITNGTVAPTAVKVTGGTVTYSVANTYTGGTTVTGGTLSLAANSLLADGGALEVATGATLNLNFTGTDQITKLTFDGVEQATGTWGAPGSGADHTDARITGTGKLLVIPFIYQWTNGGGDSLWSTAANWDINLVPATGTQLYFPSAAAGTVTNDLPSGTTLDRIRFLTGSGVYTMLGTTPTGLSGGIDNLSAAVHLIGFPIQLGTNPSIGSGTNGLGLYSDLTGVGFTKTDAGILELAGNNSYTGNTTITNGTLKVSSASALPTSTVVAFTNTTNTATLDLNGVAPTVAGLSFGTQTSGTNTVTITGSALTTSPATLSFAPLNTANNLTVDMSPLGAFTYNNAAGTLKVDGGTPVASSAGHFSTLSLSAESNSITAAALSIGNIGASSGVPLSTLNLGRNNTLNIGTISIAASLSRASGVIQFGPAVTGAKALMIRGVTGGTSTANMTVSAGNSFQVSDVDSATLDTTAGALDAMFGTVTLARASTNANGRGTTVNGTFKMGAGTMSASTMILGTIDGTGTGSTEIANALLDLSGGTASISTLTFATNSLPAGNTLTANSQVNVGGGAVLNATTIQQGAVANITTLTTRINLNDGTLGNIAGTDLTVAGVGVVLGTGTHNFAITSGQTGTISSVISGTGALTKIGAGTLALSGANTYTGDTTVMEGTASLSTAFLADTSAVSVMSGAKMNLGFSGSDVVGSLYIDGVQMAGDGATYGASGSGASVIDNVHFSGTGRIQVGVAADPFTPWINGFTSLTDPADKTKSADPDHDGRSNLLEFALDGNPASSTDDGKVRSAVSNLSGDNVLTLTLPVRIGASFTPGGDLVSAPLDGVIYKIQGSTDLSDSQRRSMKRDDKRKEAVKDTKKRRDKQQEDASPEDHANPQKKHRAILWKGSSYARNAAKYIRKARAAEYSQFAHLGPLTSKGRFLSREHRRASQLQSCHDQPDEALPMAGPSHASW